MIEVQKQSKPPSQPPPAAAVDLPAQPKTFSMRLSEPAEQTIPNAHGYNLESLLVSSEFVCLSHETLLFRLGNSFYFMQFQPDSTMWIRSFDSVSFEGMLSYCVLEAEGKVVVLTTNKLLWLESRNGRIIQKTLRQFIQPQNASNTHPYTKMSVPQRNVIFLLTTTNKLEMHTVDGEFKLKLAGSTELHLDREHHQLEIATLMMEKRQHSNKYLAVVVCSYTLNGKFERSCLTVLEIELTEGRLQCHTYEVVTVSVAGYLQVKTFILCNQAGRQYLELSLNNEILVVCRFINRYMVWECIYHKKIKEEAKTRSFGLLRYNLFYVVERFLLELYQFSFVDDKKTDRTIIKVELAQFTPDENGGVRPPLGYSFYEEGGHLNSVLLNCTITPDRIGLFFRCSRRCDVASKLDHMVALIQQHKQLQPQLDKAVVFMASKMQVSQQQVQKEIWLRWPRILQKNSHSIRKLIQVGDPRYIEKQMVELLQKNNLKLDLVEDLLVKCQLFYRKELLKQFSWQGMRRLIRCNFKVKKVKLHMLTCRTKEISLKDWQHLKHNDMDREIKSYFPEFRKYDLELALGLFPHYFLSSYYENLCHAFSLIKDVVYFVSNFNFLLPSRNRMDIWELNIDRREQQLTRQKLEKLYDQSKKKTESFATLYTASMKEHPKYMVNNDVYTTNQPLTSFDQAYYLFFTALVQSTPTIDLDLAQKALTILSELNNVAQKKRVHIGCIIDLYFAFQNHHIDLKQMFELPSEQLFERLLELEDYEMLIRIVKPVFDALHTHGLSESFEKYLNRYMCRKTVFNKHFTEILVVSRQLPQDELETILQAMLDCIYYSMEIGHAGQIQNYIEEYFLVAVGSHILRQKLLRLETLLAHEQEFIAVDPKLKLIDIELGEEVFLRKIDRYLQEHVQLLEEGRLPESKFSELIKEMTELREELYVDYKQEALLGRLLQQAFGKLKIWKHFVAGLMGYNFKVVPLARRNELLDGVIQQQKSQAYKSGTVQITTELMKELIYQYGNATFERTENLRLEFIGLFEAFGLQNKLSEAVDLTSPTILSHFKAFIDSEDFLRCESTYKNRFIELLYELSGSGSPRNRIERLRVKELELACEQALESSQYDSFLECLQEHLTRSKPQDFDMDFKVMWVRFIGQLTHEVYQTDRGRYALKKCLYMIPDFNEGMNEFFAFVTRDDQEIFQRNPIEHLKLRTSFLKKKGREWTIRRIEVIESKVKKSLKSTNNLEVMFRHLLVSEHRLAFAFLKAVLKHVDLQNIYKTCIICLESEYFTAKLDIIKLLMQIICLQFSRDYDRGMADSSNQLNEGELLKLIVKLKPNAKDEQSRNKLTFFESIITNCLNLRTFYEKLGEDISISGPQHELERSGGPGVQMETILQSLICFNESVIPMLRGGASIYQAEPIDEMSPLRIGDELVDSFEGQP